MDPNWISSNLLITTSSVNYLICSFQTMCLAGLPPLWDRIGKVHWWIWFTKDLFWDQFLLEKILFKTFSARSYCSWRLMDWSHFDTANTPQKLNWVKEKKFHKHSSNVCIWPCCIPLIPMRVFGSKERQTRKSKKWAASSTRGGGVWIFLTEIYFVSVLCFHHMSRMLVEWHLKILSKKN